VLYCSSNRVTDIPCRSGLSLTLVISADPVAIVTLRILTDFGLATMVSVDPADLVDLAGFVDLVDLAGLAGFVDLADLVDLAGFAGFVDLVDLAGFVDLADPVDLAGFAGFADLVDEVCVAAEAVAQSAAH